MGLAEHTNLSPRQGSQYAALERIASTFGQWGTGTDSEGAHYAPAAANPFKPELVCSRCAFFEADTGQCEIVKGPLASGAVEPEAVCKLWIIPQAPDSAEQQLALGTLLRDALKR